MGKLFPEVSGQVVTPALISLNGGIVRGFCPAEAGFGFAELRFAPVRRGVYPVKRGSSTFAPALKTNL